MTVWLLCKSQDAVQYVLSMEQNSRSSYGESAIATALQHILLVEDWLAVWCAINGIV